ncbi:pyridoxamine 5'-phosphate oxidase family protein [Hoyosella subflava]|uniref:Pyridoxamine 5'-phosphate oxidase-like FMN-binding protein n=1 Tax=Hoyosella subflava (strain DSM 45089 / JCM 17490 / NBRC 109087 / DQS3-9A1) TaxID=443218 RepID=F6EL03_HOYSD|nr:pyridoxamine 5'-phosphate oxidase family protein [Hoyosella subflava]AEF42666.1 Pyridoxamine 5'-phosphate oxidase-like FMN-binding protein [Hoyosella subflava DQS3-9A1]
MTSEQPLESQKRGRRIAMSKPELDVYLAAERTCRVATVSKSGPHVTPLWFVWDGECLWLYSLTRSLRWADMQRDPRIAVVVDDGHDYTELRGAELTGSVSQIGEAPRTGESVDELVEPEKLFARKYFGIDEFPHDGRHAWLRLRPDAIRSWDFRKM